MKEGEGIVSLNGFGSRDYDALPALSWLGKARR
jgi:hypothetical protein